MTRRARARRRLLDPVERFARYRAALALAVSRSIPTDTEVHV